MITRAFRVRTPFFDTRQGKGGDMSGIRFTKMHGCGNDYIYINGAGVVPEDKPLFARTYSDRHTGIGADGVIYINPSDEADFEMEMYNADGSEGKMCGNGIRCVGKYIHDKGLSEKKQLSIMTKSGIRELTLHEEDGIVDSVTVDMGVPILSPEQIPVKISSERVVDHPYTVSGKEYRITCISMGNPHCVVFTEDVWGMDLKEIGPCFENDPIFPEQVNTEFVRVKDRSFVEMRVWERGSGETFACGTGASAVVAAAVLNGKTDRKVRVKLLGGELLIEYRQDDGRIYMTGEAVTVFEGEIEEICTLR